MAGNDEIFRIILDMGHSKETAEEMIAKLTSMHAAGTSAGDGLDKVRTSSVNVGQSMLQTGRVIQDFTQGGIGGILNNVEGMVSALGMGAGMAGLLTAVGTAAFIALPHIKRFVQGMIDGANAIPESTDNVKRLTEAIAANAKELDALHEKHVLTNTELARYNELTASQVKLEKEATEARKQRKREEEFDAVRPAGDAKHENAQAEALRNLVGTPAGRQQEMIQETGEAMLARKYKAWEAEYNAMPSRDKMTPDQANRHQQLIGFMSKYQKGKFKGAADPVAKEELAKAVAGDRDALAGLMHTLPEGSTTREILRQGSPEELEAQRLAKREAEETRAKTAKAQQEEKARAAQQTEWEAQGRKNAREAAAKREAADKHHEEQVKHDQDDIAADVNRRQEETRKRVEGTDIDERAASRAGLMRAQGGRYDEARDRMIRMTPQQQEAYNQRLTEREIGQRFPAMPQGERQTAARQVTQGATQQVQQQIQEATISAMNAGLDSVQAQQQAAQVILQRLKLTEMRANALTRDARALRPRQLPFADNGAPG